MPGRRSEAPSLVVTTHSEARFVSSVPAPLLQFGNMLPHESQYCRKAWIPTPVICNRHFLLHVIHAARTSNHLTTVEGDSMLEVQVRAKCMPGNVASVLASAA